MTPLGGDWTLCPATSRLEPGNPRCRPRTKPSGLRCTSAPPLTKKKHRPGLVGPQADVLGGKLPPQQGGGSGQLKRRGDYFTLAPPSPAPSVSVWVSARGIRYRDHRVSGRCRYLCRVPWVPVP